MDYAVRVTPIEETTLADGTDKVRTIASAIDKVVAGGIEQTGVGLKYKDYTLTSSGVALADSTIFNTNLYNKHLCVVIREHISGGTPECEISLDGGSSYPIELSGVGDLCFIRTPILTYPWLNVLIRQKSGSGSSKVDIIASNY